MNILNKSIFFSLLVLFFTPFSYAQEVKDKNFIQTALLSYENDSLYGKDRYYTNGLQLLFTTRENLKTNEDNFLFKILNIQNIDFSNFSFGLGQKIYTSNDIEIETKIENDRPYSGYLYLFLNKNIFYEKKKVNTFGLSLGLTGSSSLGRKVQTEIHNLIGSPIPKGWKGQLDNELLIMLSFMQTISVRDTEKYKYDWNLIYRNVVNIGTPFTNINPSIEFRFGWNLDTDLVSNKIQTTSLGIQKNQNFSGNSYYFFLEFSPDIIFYDTFLYGNLFGTQPNIDINFFRYNIMIGCTLRLSNFYIKYSTNFLSKEFKEQKEAQIIGLISVGYLF